MANDNSTNDNNSNSYDVFLSHGSPDKEWVRQLHGRLEEMGVKVYLDEIAIEPGKNFVRELSDAIGQTPTLVIVASRGTAERLWVEHEWTSSMATHGPRHRTIPVLLEEVQLPPFLRPYQAIHAVDRNAEAVAARIAHAVGKSQPDAPGASASPSAPAAAQLPATYTGQSLIFTVASAGDTGQLAVTSTDGTQRTIAAPWRLDNAFGIALMDFERLTGESVHDNALRAQLIQAAQTIGAALFDALFSDDALQSNFARATAPGARAVVSVQSDDDVLLSLPWELLYHDSRFLVRDGLIDVVRSTTGAVQAETQLTPPSAPFTVVTHIAAPEGSGLRYEEESYRITHVLTDHCAQTATELGTLEDLVKTVTRNRPRGIHFSGHGNPRELVFEDDGGFAAPVAIESVVTAIRQESDGTLPPFFFLASCHGNTPARPAEGQSGSASSAAQLHRAGVTEVVGYYGPIDDELSTRAEEALYGAIATGHSTRLAVARARAALQRAFDGDPSYRPANLEDFSHARSGHGATAKISHVAPFAWAQVVLYRRGPEHPLGTPASPQEQRQREASLQRTYRHIDDRAFLATGFIGRRRELHQLRRRRKRGDRVFVLQGLGGLGKTTLAGHLLPSLADTEHTVTIWCRRSEGEAHQAEALVGQLLAYARARFGAGFEHAVTGVDRAEGDDAARRFAAFVQIVLAQQAGVPLVLYFDNLESLLHGPETVSLDTAPDAGAFGSWRSNDLQRLWRIVGQLATAVGNLYVVASCRYRNDDLTAGLLPVSALAEVDLFRLMAWFPALRQLSTSTRRELAARLCGHPRAVEILDALMAASISTWENVHGEWRSPAAHDTEGRRREWKELVKPVLPDVEDRLWADLLLAALWDRVLDKRGQRMLFRMTLLRRPWSDPLLPHLGDPEDDEHATRRTAHMLAATSLLEQIALTVRTQDGRLGTHTYFTVHPATAAFVKRRFVDVANLATTTHRRVGHHLEEQGRASLDMTVALEAGHHLFEAGEYERAGLLLGELSQQLDHWGRVREALHLVMPFLAEPIQSQMSRSLVARLISSNGHAYLTLGDPNRALELFNQALLVAEQADDVQIKGTMLSHLGTAYRLLGEPQRALGYHEEALAISRQVGDREAEGQDLGNVGNIYLDLDDPRRALAIFLERLAIAHEIGDRRGESTALGNIGVSYFNLREPRRALDFFEQQLVICMDTHDRVAELTVVGNIGSAYAELGDPGRAIACYERQLLISREVGERRMEGHALTHLGNLYAQLGSYARAIELCQQGLEIGRMIGNRQIIQGCEITVQQSAAAMERHAPEESEPRPHHD